MPARTNEISISCDDEVRLTSDRARKRQKRLSQSADEFDNRVQFPVLPSAEILHGIHQKCSRRLSNSHLGEVVCCVCDCFHPQWSSLKKQVPASPVLMTRIKSRLRAPPGLHPNLLKCYDVSDLLPDLRGVLLSPEGFISAGQSYVLSICKSCNQSLMNKNLVNPPKFEIANGLYIGWQDDEFNDTTPTEHAMLNLAQPTKMLSVVRGGRHTAIRAHAYYFRADPTTPAAMLPREVVSDGTIGVTIVGCMTPHQKAATFKRYNVRVQRLEDQMKWYKDNNILFKTVRTSPSFTTSTSMFQTQVILDRSTETSDPVATAASDELDAACSRFNAPDPAHINVEKSDEQNEHYSTAILTNFKNGTESQMIQKAFSKKHKNTVVVRRSSAIVSDFNTGFWTVAFVELFPFGRGGLDEPRELGIGLEEYLRYCLRLSSRRHARHHSFTLVAFDVLAGHKAMHAIYLRVKMSPVTIATATGVGRAELVQHLERQEDRLKNLATNTPVGGAPATEQNIRNLYSFITTGMRAHYGSNEERSRARSDLLAMQLVYGQLSIFFTLSPSSSTSYRVAAFAGEVNADVLDVVTEQLDSSIHLTKSKLGAVAASNPSACARYEIMVVTFSFFHC